MLNRDIITYLFLGKNDRNFIINTSEQEYDPTLGMMNYIKYYGYAYGTVTNKYTTSKSPTGPNHTQQTVQTNTFTKVDIGQFITPIEKPVEIGSGIGGVWGPSINIGGSGSDSDSDSDSESGSDSGSNVTVKTTTKETTWQCKIINIADQYIKLKYITTSINPENNNATSTLEHTKIIPYEMITSIDICEQSDIDRNIKTGIWFTYKSSGNTAEYVINLPAYLK